MGMYVAEHAPVTIMPTCMYLVLLAHPENMFFYRIVLLSPCAGTTDVYTSMSIACILLLIDKEFCIVQLKAKCGFN